MCQTLLSLQRARRVAAVLAALGGLACYGRPASNVSPAPILFRWPEPAFEPARQCRGGYTGPDLARYLPRARLALWLPNTVAVALDERRGCLRVAVEDVGTGRLVELLLRGVAVPRRAVLLELRDLSWTRAS